MQICPKITEINLGIDSMEKKDFCNNELLINLIHEHSLKLDQALEMLNSGQATKLSMRAFKSYIATPDVKTSAPCPAGILDRLKYLVNGHKTEEEVHLSTLVRRLSRALKSVSPENPLIAEAAKALSPYNSSKR